MSARISFTQPVRVQLTEQGVKQFEDFFEELRDGQQQPREAFPSLPTPDADGWYSMELWMLVSVFGGSSIWSPSNTEMLFRGNVMVV